MTTTRSEELEEKPGNHLLRRALTLESGALELVQREIRKLCGRLVDGKPERGDEARYERLTRLQRKLSERTDT